MSNTAETTVDRINDLVDKITDNDTYLADKIIFLEKENYLLRDLVRKHEIFRDQAEGYENILKEIASITGCGHLDENLPRCVIQTMDNKFNQGAKSKDIRLIKLIRGANEIMANVYALVGETLPPYLSNLHKVWRKLLGNVREVVGDDQADGNYWWEGHDHVK